jgi:hypothetical protein
MPSLIDLAPLREQVDIRGVKIDVFGISVKNIAQILFRFPELRKMLIRIDPGSDVIGQLISRVPELLGLLVACGCGADLENPESEKIITAASNLMVGEQWLVIEKVIPMTFPQGVNRFMAGVQGLLEQADGGRGRAPATTSAAPSNSASSTEETSESAGAQPQGS